MMTLFYKSDDDTEVLVFTLDPATGVSEYSYSVVMNPRRKANPVTVPLRYLNLQCP